MRAASGDPLGCALLLPVSTVNYVAIMKACTRNLRIDATLTMNSATAPMTSHNTQGLLSILSGAI